MRASQLYAPTLREVPAEAELISHQYMLRAGLMRKSASGIYSYLPLGIRVLHKIMEIIREELDKADAQEILLPIVQPAELWEESGRWNEYGPEMFRLQDRHQRHFCLGPTHEEIITALVRADVRSYRQLPLRLYQIQNKYRDEIRPRFGVIRSREFIMKDLYSFDRDEVSAQESYRAMYDAYTRIFARCGLKTHPVEADTGAIGGDQSHEFMVLGDAGEDLIVFCPDCGYAANVERAECAPFDSAGEQETLAELEEIATPDVTTVEELTRILKIAPGRVLKTMIYLADEKPVAVLIGGDYDVNEIKLKRAIQCNQLELAGAQTIREVTKAPVGFAGPIGLGIPVYADYSVERIVNGVSGANKEGYHLRNVNIYRDYTPAAILDLREARAGEKCVRCGKVLDQARGTEVGQVFYLGTKYSMPIKAHFVDQDGQEMPFVMGCYGIGVSRTMAAIIEQHHDEDGICWPVSVAPFAVIIVPVSYKDDEQRTAADGIYKILQDAGIEVILDDRDERPGVKFKDADLIGYPLRITVGPKHLKEGYVELKLRSSHTQLLVSIDDVKDQVESILDRIGE
ncbi:MAG: proline--tRNA ligase [Firmicutes bacterium]|jgi:prolyl-tRNA synthetase|nr:proline--tRNA ligase [Bacillota bacterium]NLL88056.1 proline--tRNA ligase [Bacillota bacterium]HKM18078.1 proline--tRNA ligase [Limnochordia bacterium]